MRIRTIKPSFWTSEDLASVTDQAALLAIGLLNYADDEGYFSANPHLIRAALFPLRPVKCVNDLLFELRDIGYLELTVGTDGRDYGRVVSFTDHQRVSHPAPSLIRPRWKTPEDSVNAHGTLRGPSCLKGREGKGREVEGATPTADGDDVLEQAIVRGAIHLAEPGRPIVPAKTVGDLVALGAAVGREDRGDWDAALKARSFDALAAGIGAVRARGAKAWLNVVIDEIDKTGPSIKREPRVEVIDGIAYTRTD